MTSSDSLHWLLEPHIKLMEHLRPLCEVEVTAGVTLVPVTPPQVATFVACEHSLHERRVGPALKEHLERFGSALAAMAMANETAVGCIRARLFHEYDPSLETILVSFLGVSPTHRNRGIGTRLITHLSSTCLACPQLRGVAAEVDVGNDPSLRAFAGAGFTAVSRRDGKVILMAQRPGSCE
jgi:ribosomal protein S18 acetylase RimI-like enzyme